MTFQNNPFFLHKQKLENPELNQEKKAISSEIKKTNPFFELSEKNKNIESPFDDENFIEKEIERNSARLTSRGLETIGGFAGDIRDFAKAGKKYYQENIKPNIPGLKDLQEPKGFEKFDEIVQPINDMLSYAADWFPTSHELKKTSEEYTKGYTKPQSEFEEMGDEMFQGIISSFFPGQGERGIVRNLVAPIGSVLAKQIAKSMGIEEKGQAATQFGANVFINMMTGSAPRLNKEIWHEIETTAPIIKGTVSIPSQRNRAQSLISKIETTGLGSAGEQKVVSTLEKFLENTKSGQLTAEQLVGMNKSINEIRGDPALLSGSKKMLNQVSDIVKDSGKGFAHIEPEFYNLWNKGNEVHGVIAQSNFIARTVEKIANKPTYSEGTRAILSSIAHGGASSAGSLPPLFALYKGTQILTRIANSKELTKYYTNVILNASKGNAAATAASISKLDKEVKKIEKEKGPIPEFQKTQDTL